MSTFGGYLFVSNNRTSEQLGIWYGYSIQKIVFIVLSNNMCFILNRMWEIWSGHRPTGCTASDDLKTGCFLHRTESFTPVFI